MSQPGHRDVHFWSEQLTEPPCGTLEDRFDWSEAVEDVTCVECLESLAGDSGDLGSPDDPPGEPDHAPSP